MLWEVAPAGAIGAHRLTLSQAAAVSAASALAERRLKVANQFASEAVAARVIHDLREKNAWTYFGPVAGTPGFAGALAATLVELRLEAQLPSRAIAMHTQPTHKRLSLRWAWAHKRLSFRWAWAKPKNYRR
jgi:hypothetical protein